MKVGDIGTMVGQVISLPVPEGWLHCNGACYDGRQFPELYELLKDNVMLGDPPGYFRVPAERKILDGVPMMLIVRAK